MDLKSLSLGERIAAASGAVLFVCLFVPWLEGRHAWKLFSWVDILLALLALIAVGLPLVKAVAGEQPFRVSMGTVLARVGLVALTTTAIFVIEGADRDITILLPLLAAIGILYGGMTTPEEGAERGRGRRRGERARREYADEDFEEPPPGMEGWRAGRSWGAEGFEDTPMRAPAGAEDEARSEREPARGAEGSRGPRPGRTGAGGEPTEVREPRRRPEGRGSGGL